MPDDTSLQLRFLDRAVHLRLRTPDAARVRDRLRDALIGFARAEDAPAPDRPAPSTWTVTREPEGYRLESDPETGAADSLLPDARTLVHEVEWRVARRLLPTDDRWLPLHGSGFVLDGRAVLAVGASGSGKSTLAFEAWCAGGAVLGDDVVLVGADGGVRGFPRLMKVPLAALAGRDHPAPGPDWVDEENAEGWFDPTPRWAAASPAPALLVFPEWTGESGSEVRSPKAAERLERLLRAVQGEGEARPRLSMLLDRLGEPPAIQLSFGDAGDALATLRERILDPPDGSGTILKGS